MKVSQMSERFGEVTCRGKLCKLTSFCVRDIDRPTTGRQ